MKVCEYVDIRSLQNKLLLKRAVLPNQQISLQQECVLSVLARLKNKGKESGRSYQLCLQLFCQEEFLR